jgi:drug/metabolite transporter (DMT)-like permease
LEPVAIESEEAHRHHERERLVAAAQCLFVTFLWATSWILIKIGLTDLDLRPISFAGLRYALAAAIMVPIGWRALRLARSRGHGGLDRRLWSRLAFLGLVFYAVAQGAQFAALAVLPAAAVGLVLSSIPVWVAAVAWVRGGEEATAPQVVGILLLLAGGILYFGPFELGQAAWLGLAAAALCAVASTSGQHVARDLNRDVQARLGGPAGLTAMSMAIGGVALLTVGVALEGWPALDLRGWAIVGWLAAVNTAFAFTLYNHTLRVLTAVESSVIVNTLLIMVAIMAWVILGERLDARQIAGLGVATLGVIVVQVAPRLWRPA